MARDVGTGWQTGAGCPLGEAGSRMLSAKTPRGLDLTEERKREGLPASPVHRAGVADGLAPSVRGTGLREGMDR